jgi:glycerol-3-phosphate dehydrogenase
VEGVPALVDRIRARYPFLAERHARRLVRAYGTGALALLDGARGAADLGPVYGADLTQAELRYLVRTEWATTAEDVLWRRSKLGLRLTPAQIAAVEQAMQALADSALPQATAL